MFLLVYVHCGEQNEQTNRQADRQTDQALTSIVNYAAVIEDTTTCPYLRLAVNSNYVLCFLWYFLPLQ